MSSRATSPSDFDLAVVSLSARALARSARRAGLKVLAIDLFADGDTRSFAETAVRVRAARSGQGFDRRDLLATLESHAPEGLPVVFGAGLEHAPRLMAAIARRNPILGADPRTVALLKDPFALAELLASIGVAHPEVVATDHAGERSGRWLSKRAGGSGGGHIRLVRDARTNLTEGATLPPPPPCGEGKGGGGAKPSAAIGGRAASGVEVSSEPPPPLTPPHKGEGNNARRYLQQRVEGLALSALFLANGAKARIIGFSEQWPDPTPRAPFRYGGGVGPVPVEGDLAQEIAASLDRIVAATGLFGLASADMIIRGGDAILLEINPRPGATLDLFDRGDMPSLLALHLEACAGRLPDRLPAFASVQAAAIVYSDRPVSVGHIPMPGWTADWPSCEETIAPGSPVCTLFASGASPSAARALLLERREALLASLRAGLPASATPMVSA